MRFEQLQNYPDPHAMTSVAKAGSHEDRFTEYMRLDKI